MGGELPGCLIKALDSFLSFMSQYYSMQWIFTHGDIDGICSGAIAFAAHRDAKIFFTHPKGLAEDLSQAKGDVIICDIALPSDSFMDAINELIRIKDEGGRAIYIDHHPLPNDFDPRSFPGECFHSLNACASELTFLRFQKDLDPNLNRVAIYGAVGDYMDDTYNIEKFLLKWDRAHVYLESGLLSQAIDAFGKNYDVKRGIALYLSDNRTPSSDERIVSKAISESISDEWNRKRIKELVKVSGNIAYTFGMDWSMGKAAVYAMAETEKLVGIGAEARRENVEMSLRTETDGLDLNKLLNDVAKRLGGSGGGHPKAAGARVPAEKFLTFLEQLNASISTEIKGSTTEY